MNILTFAKWIEGTAPEWILSLPENLQRIIFQFYQVFVYENRWKFFTDGLITTFVVTIGALILGVIIGMIVAIIRSSCDSMRKKPNIFLRILNSICKIYVTVLRGTPLMVQLLIMGFVIMVPKGDFETNLCAVITLGINSGAYVAEIARSGIMSISQGQTEAGRSLGLNYWQTMCYIVIPQAFKNILPALGNELIALLKETSVAGYVAITDL
ncbi:MAG: amino acid ABC transporter permease, partial [Clostridia bacterium]|nr:amino acid ABC transporter permease [Clostridia bacterium]